MGEAKNNSDILRKTLLKGIEKWTHPPSEIEDRMVADVQKLPVVRVTRQPQHTLDHMRMKPGQCHQNCVAYVDLDPDHKSKHILGWIYMLDSFVVHSVIETDGGLI